MDEVDRNFENFRPAVQTLIIETVTLMRRYEMGYPTLDRLTRHIDSFISLLSPALIGAIRVGADFESDDGTGDYLDLLTEPAAFVSVSQAGKHARALIFWAFVRAIQDLALTAGQYGLNEVARNAGLFGHLASNLRTFRTLEDVGRAGEVRDLVYWADFASSHHEQKLGADFALVIGLGDDRYKVAFMQAKRVGQFPSAYVGYKVGERRQVDLLVNHESLHPIPGPATGGASDCENHTIYGRWCFYVFWHELTADGELLLPTVRSAHAVKKTMKGGYANSLENGVELAAFASLLLADPDSTVGYLAGSATLPPLFQNHQPHALIFVDPPSNGPTPEDKAKLLAALGYKKSPVRLGAVLAMSPPPAAPSRSFR